MALNFGNLAAGAQGAVAGLGTAQDYQIRQMQIEAAKRAQVEGQAVRERQQGANAAFANLMRSTYGAQQQPVTPTQSPMPGQPSVPMMQAGAGAPGPTAQPQLPPYRALPQAGGTLPTSTPQGFSLPPKPPRPQMDMESVMANAPQDPETFNLYMQQVQPYLSAQQKTEMDELRLENTIYKTQAQLAQTDERIKNAPTREERDYWRQVNADLRKQALDQQKERDRQKAATVAGKTTAASEKRQASEAARSEAADLVTNLRAMIQADPSIVGMRGKLSRGMEAVGGMVGGTNTIATDFQQQVLMLQNILKKYEPYGPEGRLKEGMVDRDKIVMGLGSWTSAPSADSSLRTIEKFLDKYKPAQNQPPAAPSKGAAPPPPSGFTEL